MRHFTRSVQEMKSRLEVVLADRRMKKGELAKSMGVSRQTVSSWVSDRGMSTMTVGRLCRLAEVLGCDPRDLFEP